MTEKEFQAILERQRKREERRLKREKRKEDLEAVGATVATVAAVVGTYMLGKKAIKSGIPAKVIKSQGFKEANKNISAITDFVSGYSKAVSSTFKTKKFGIFTDDASELLAKNFKKYLGDYKSKGSVDATPNLLFKYLQDRNKLIDVRKAHIIRDQQIKYAKNVIKDVAKQKPGAKMDAAKNFFDDLLEQEKNRIFVETQKRGGKASFDYVYQSLDDITKELKKSGKIDDFSDEFEELVNAIAKDGGFKTIANKTSGESFYSKVIQQSKTLSDDFNKQMKEFQEATLKAVSETMKKRDSATGKMFEASGASRVTVDDIMRDPSKFAKYDARKFSKDFDPIKTLNEIKGQLDDQAWKEFSETIVDPALIRDGSDIIDLRHFGITKDSIIDNLAENVEIPFIGIKPFQYVKLLNRSIDRAAPSAYAFARGTMMDTINNGAGALQDDFYAMGSYLLNSKGEVVNDSVRLIANSPYTVEGNIVRRMTGRAVRAGSENANTFQKVTDMGLQGSRTYWDEFKNWRLNKNDPLSYRNLHEKFIRDQDVSYLVDEDASQAFRTFIGEVAENSRKVVKDVDGVTIKAFDPSKIGGLNNELSKDVNALYKAFTENDRIEDIVDSFLASDADEKTIKHITNILERNTNTRNYSGAFKEMQWTFFDDIGFENTKSIADDLLNQNAIGKAEHQNLEALSHALFSSGVAKNPTTHNQAMFQVKAFSDESYHKMLNGFYSESKKFKYELPQNFTMDPFEGNKMIVIGESKNTISNTINKINERIKNGESPTEAARDVWSYISGTYREMGFGTKANRAGASNMGGVTNKSIGSYFYFSRLSDALDPVMLGLNPKDMTSTQDVVKNLYLKRILLPLTAISAVAYTNDMLGEVTGEEPSDTFAGAYARMTLDVQAVKDFFGVNKLTQKWGHVLEGFDRLYETPVGGAVKYGTFGILGEDRGYEDLKYYYERGEDPVRKGRYWPIGSTTPWRGGRIEQWRPSWYRRVIGEPAMTDSLWGSESEYWSQHWMPNPHNLIGPLKRVIDPYHWENKHKYTRPFAVSGGIQELEQTPLVGPLLDATVGRVIKPSRINPRLKSSHEEYIEGINTAIKDQYWSEIDGGAGNGVAGEIPTSELVGNSAGSYAYSEGAIAAEIPGRDNASVNSAARQSIGQGGAQGATYQTLTAMNQNTIAKASKSRSRSADIDTLRDDFYVGDLSTVEDPNAIGVRLSDTYYSAVEVGGIYGFITEEIFGDQEPDRVLENSSWAFSARREFWDEELGGLGGPVSEIYRRFLPNSRNIDTYNPIRNQMPEWLPSYNNYFIDFLHGDPYSKVPNGEEVLPGPGYESINKLHSDPYFGRYGALDRMKILGNVAPWSAQYKYYSKVVTTLHDEGVISDEDYKIAEVTREQVRERKKKYDFSDYKFQHPENIEYQRVTVDTVLDDYSFTTLQNPGVIYKLAGIKMPAQDDERRAEVEEYLNSVIHGGARLKIGVTKDGLNYFSSDTRNTVRVSVYDGGNTVQRNLIGKYKVEGDYEKTDDASVDALYTPLERGIGKAWEKVAHADIPIINKYIGSRSAVEEYERSQVYGKEFQRWTLTGSDFIGPTINKMAIKNPISASATGAIIGAATGLFTKNKKAAAVTNAMIGAAIGGGAASVRTVDEAVGRVFDKDYAWIPASTQKKREYNEYFDKLRYVKYKGLYEKAADLARRYEGFDPDRYNPERNKPYTDPATQQELEGVKKWLAVGVTDGANMDEQETRAKMKMIDEFLNGTEGEEEIGELGTYGKLALQYKNEYESTVFGADPYGDFSKIFAALPKSDKPFFQKFMSADPQERARILKLVPDDQKKFYQARWGKKVKKQTEKEKERELAQYFKNHGGLPDDNWDGWEAGESLEKVKVKFLDRAGEDPRNYGYFKDDIDASKWAPSLGLKPRGRDFSFNAFELKRVLRGYGLRDVEVLAVASYVENPVDRMRINMHVKHDRTKDMERTLYHNIGNYV